MGIGIQPIGGFFKKGGAINLDIASGATLPLIVVENRIFAISETQAINYYFNTDAPISPLSGDIWIVAGSGQYGLSFKETSPFFEINIMAANQWNGTAWDSLDAYIGKNGAWVQCASALPPIGTPLAAFTPEQIQRVALGGLATQYFQVGDTHTMPINGVPYDIEIVDFNHDVLALESGNAPITFGMKNCLATAYRMNATNTNAGGYTGSEFYATLKNTIFSQISAEWRAIMRPITKLTSAGGSSSAINSSTETIFLFSEIEILGARTYSADGEGTHYPKFSTAASRIKSRSGTASVWWLRSPRLSSTTAFCSVAAAGAADASYTSTSYGAAFGFCV